MAGRADDGYEGPHLTAVRRDLDALPEDLRTSSTAAAAEGLARSLDLGTEAYRFQAGLVSQLRECMTELYAKAPAKPEEGDTVDEINARRAARRRTASAG